MARERLSSEERTRRRFARRQWRRRWGVGPETNEDGTDDAGNDDAESSPTATNRGGEER